MKRRLDLTTTTTFWRWCLVLTLAFELITIACRIAIGQSGAEYLSPQTHWLIRMHHMFWAIPLLLLAAAMSKQRLWQARLSGVAAGLVLSDLLHHFVVLPLWVGNIGWHWP